MCIYIYIYILFFFKIQIYKSIAKYRYVLYNTCANSTAFTPYITYKLIALLTECIDYVQAHLGPDLFGIFLLLGKITSKSPFHTSFRVSPIVIAPAAAASIPTSCECRDTLKSIGKKCATNDETPNSMVKPICKWTTNRLSHNRRREQYVYTYTVYIYIYVCVCMI